MGDYLYYRKITVDKTKVGEIDTNFAVLLNLTTAGSGIITDLKTIANGGDIQHTASGGASGAYTVPADLTFRTTADLTQAGAKLDFEIEFYDAATGALIAHVQSGVDTVADTDIYMIYGNADVVTSQENVEGTWDAGYKAVWHLAETGALPQCLDSTANNNDAFEPSEAAATTPNAAGRINGCQEFDGTDDSIAVPTSSSLNITGPLLVEAWIKCDNFNNHRGIVSKPKTNKPAPWDMYVVVTSAKVSCLSGDGTSYDGMTGGTTLIAGTWYYVVFRRTGSPGDLELYLSGISDATPVSGTVTPSGYTDNLWIGTRTDGATRMDGLIDEVRISNTARTANYVTTCFNNQSSPSTFYNVGAEQTTGQPMRHRIGRTTIMATPMRGIY